MKLIPTRPLRVLAFDVTLVALATALLFTGPWSSGQESAGEKAAAQDTKAASEKKSVEPAETGKKEKDPFEVPEGTPEELVKYLRGLMQLEPPGRDRDSVKPFAEKLSKAATTAADRILAAKPKATEGQAELAMRAKMGVYQLLLQLGDEGVAKKMQDVPESFEKAGFPKLARQARGMNLQVKFARLSSNDPAEFQKLIDEVKAYLSAGEVQGTDIQLAVNAAMMAEEIGAESAAKAYQEFAKILAKSENKRIASFAAKLEGAARRMGLVGKAMDVEGKTLADKPLEWDKYRGKVVLIDFWATWCGPCRKEIPNILKAYQGYKDKGFDVVGISRDEDRKQLETFVNDEKLPWTIVVDTAAETEEKDTSMGTKYGVFAIPEMILVGADGKVVARGNAIRGEGLDKQLEKLLGPPAQKAEKPEKTDAEKKSG